jgi:hypothetical protein
VLRHRTFASAKDLADERLEKVHINETLLIVAIGVETARLKFVEQSLPKDGDSRL